MLVLAFSIFKQKWNFVNIILTIYSSGLDMYYLHAWILDQIEL